MILSKKCYFKIQEQFKMKILTFLITVLLTSLTFGQQENATYKSITDNFERNYNSDNFDAIFADFSSEMQIALPIDKTIAFFSSLKQHAGKITNREFIKYEQTYASYKTTFEKAVFAVNISIDSNSKINGFFVKPFVTDNPQKSARNISKLILPFHGEWKVVWGGDTKELNYHVESEAQKNAFDIVIIDNKGSSFKTDGKSNEDYYAFGKELIAPCDGEIVLVVDGVKDNIPGILNPVYVPGNTVILKTQNNEYLFFAHFKQHSIVVKQGQKVKQGQLLGLCGNSGNSSEPHLHFHIQNNENMMEATGIKCYFENVLVNGKIMNEYSPIREDKIKNNN